MAIVRDRRFCDVTEPYVYLGLDLVSVSINDVDVDLSDADGLGLGVDGQSITVSVVGIIACRVRTSLRRVVQNLRLDHSSTPTNKP